MTDKYAVFGHPIAHSKSPFIHGQFAHQTEQKMTYEAILAPKDSFVMAFRQFVSEGGKGANVTLPFKEQAFDMCDALSDEAQLAGAVNTLSVDEAGKITGNNTDGLGLADDLLAHVGTLKNKKVLLVGAGGAARGCILPLIKSGISQLVITNRTFHKAQGLVEHFQTQIQSLDKNNHSGSVNKLSAIPMNELTTPFDIIVNSTSASISGSIPDLPFEVIAPETVCYDMMYAREITSFNAWAQTQGATTVIDGLGMLVSQAAHSFSIWRGVYPDTDSVLFELRKSMG